MTGLGKRDDAPQGVTDPAGGRKEVPRERKERSERYLTEKERVWECERGKEQNLKPKKKEKGEDKERAANEQEPPG